MKRIVLGFSWLTILLFIGSVGFKLIENASWIDAFYMTLITISTVGFREVVPLSNLGKIWTMLLIVSGVGLIFYTASSSIEFMVEGHFGGLLEKRRLKKMRDRLQGHTIICGYGRVGKQVAQEMAKRKYPFIVVEIDAEKVAEAQKKDYLVLNGDASKEETLLEAGIKRARFLVAALDSDSQNVFVVLAAKQLNPELSIVARANEEESEALLFKAGASHVVSPTIIGGRKIASVILKPAVAEFLDRIFPEESSGFELDEIEITEKNPFLDKDLKELNFEEKFDLIILGVKKKGKGVLLASKPGLKLERGDKLVIAGKVSELKKFLKSSG